MALSILRHDGVDVLHTAAHDLESVTYVLTHAVTNCAGPNDNFRVIGGPPSIPMLEWFKLNPEDSYRKLGRVKQGHFVDVEVNVIQHISPYFNILKPMIADIYRALFPEGMRGYAEPKITHATMLAILEENITLLRRVGEDPSPPVPPLLTPNITHRSSEARGPTYPKKCSNKAITKDAPAKRNRRDSGPKPITRSMVNIWSNTTLQSTGNVSTSSANRVPTITSSSRTSSPHVSSSRASSSRTSTAPGPSTPGPSSRRSSTRGSSSRARHG